MKNLKKVLALVLAFATASTMMASALVFEDIKVGSDYAEAITFLSDLGVITGKDDGKYHPEDTITRAEACALIARMMTGETSVSKWTGASTFVDVPASHWAESAIGYCVANGVVKGYGDGIFKPDQQITDEEFVAMLTRAMGYDTPAAPLAYPYGNLTKAQDMGLMEGVSIVPGSPALRGEDAQMIYNAVFADYARSSNFSNLVHGSDDVMATTIAEEVFGLGRFHLEDEDGDCFAHTAVVLGADCDEENTYVAYFVDDKDNEVYDDELFTFTYDYDATELVGYEVELWGDITHTKDNDVMAIKVMGVQETYDWNSTMDAIDDDEVTIDDVDLDLSAAMFFDEDDMNTRNGFQYTLFDWDADEVVDYVKTTAVLYGEVIDLTSKTLRLELTDGTDVTFDADDTTSSVDGSGAEDWVEALIGDACHTGDVDVEDHDFYYEIPEDLEEGDVVELIFAGHIYDCTLPVAMSIVDAETMSITGTDMEDGFTEFDDELIKIADTGFYFGGKSGDTYVNYYGCDEDDDVLYDVTVDANGYVIKMVESDTAYTGYMFVTGWKNGSTGTGSKANPIVSFVADDNSYNEDVTVANDAEIYANAYLKDVELEEVYDEDSRSLDYKDRDDKGLVMGRAFKYAMNDDGEITKMYEVASDVRVENYTYTDGNDRLSPANDTAYYMDQADVIFAVRDEAMNVTANVYFSAEDDGFEYDDKYDIDYKDVMAVTYDMIPDIGDDEKVEDMGVRYDVKDADDDFIGAAVLGVDNFSYFAGVEVYFAVVSELNERNGYYEVEAYIPQMEGAATYNTADEDTVVGKFKYMSVDDKGIETEVTVNTMDELITYFESDEQNNPAVYAEVEVIDGEIIAIDVMDDGSNNDTNLICQGDKYRVERVVVERIVNSNLNANYLTYLTDESGDAINVANIVDPAEDYYVNITDDTYFAEIDDDARELSNDYVLFTTELKANNDSSITDIMDDSSASKYNDSYNAKDKSEYVIADIVVETTSKIADGDDAVAVLYFDEYIDADYDYGDVVEKVNAGTAWVENTNEATVVYDAEAAQEVKLAVTVDGELMVETVTSVASPLAAVSAEDADDFVLVTIPAGTDVGDYKVVVEYAVPDMGTLQSTFIIVVDEAPVSATVSTTAGVTNLGSVDVNININKEDQVNALAALKELNADVKSSSTGTVLYLSYNEDGCFTVTNNGAIFTPAGDSTFTFVYAVGNYEYTVKVVFPASMS